MSNKRKTDGGDATATTKKQKVDSAGKKSSTDKTVEEGNRYLERSKGPSERDKRKEAAKKQQAAKDKAPKAPKSPRKKRAPASTDKAEDKKVEEKTDANSDASGEPDLKRANTMEATSAEGQQFVAQAEKLEKKKAREEKKKKSPKKTTPKKEKPKKA